MNIKSRLFFSAAIACSYSVAASADAVGDDPVRVEQFIEKRDLVTSEDYPIESRIRGHSGVSEISLSVNPEGRPTTCLISSTSGYPLLDKATCQVFIDRAKYNLPDDAKKSAKREALHKIRWALDVGEPRPLLFGVKLAGESAFDSSTKLCKFDDGYTVRVSIAQECVLKLVKEPYSVIDKRAGMRVQQQLNIAEIYQIRSNAGDAVASFNYGLILVRFGYEQWADVMKRSADQGSTLGAHYMCVTDSRALKAQLPIEEKIKYCKAALLGGMPQAADYLGVAIAEDKILSPYGKVDRIKAIDTETKGLFLTSGTALGALGVAYFEMASQDQAFNYLYNLVLRGDVQSRQYVGRILLNQKSKYYNRKAGEVWLRAYGVALERAGKKPDGDRVANSPDIAPGLVLQCDSSPSSCDDSVAADVRRAALELTSPSNIKYSQSEIIKTGVVRNSDYPFIARAKDVYGVTRHMYRVGIEGAVDECYTLQSNLIFSMDSVACKRMGEGVYKSATFNGAPIPSFRTQPVRWSLTGPTQNSTGAVAVLLSLLGIILR